jgi:hypothetical protein
VSKRNERLDKREHKNPVPVSIDVQCPHVASLFDLFAPAPYHAVKRQRRGIPFFRDITQKKTMCELETQADEKSLGSALPEARSLSKLDDGI